MTESDIDVMALHYAITALWTTPDWPESGEPTGNLDATFTVDDIDPDAMTLIRADCADFFAANAADLADIPAEQAGHDFLLTRDGHGAGFWDRGLGDLGDRLTAASEPYRDSGLYAHDRKVYVQ